MKEKQKKLLRNIASRKFKTVRAAAVDAGYSAQATSGSLTKAIKSAHGAYLNALVQAGATDEKSARVISEGMDAEAYTMTGTPYPNHKARLAANEQFLKVKRILSNDEPEKEVKPFHLTIEIKNENNITPETGNRISEYVQV